SGRPSSRHRAAAIVRGGAPRCHQTPRRRPRDRPRSRRSRVTRCGSGTRHRRATHGWSYVDLPVQGDLDSPHTVVGPDIYRTTERLDTFPHAPYAAPTARPGTCGAVGQRVAYAEPNGVVAHVDRHVDWFARRMTE